MTSSYYFALSRRPDQDAAVVWRPVSVFRLHAAPDSVEESPRVAHKVRPLLGGVHVDSGPTFLHDISISLRTGQSVALGTSSAGAPAILTGRERAAALRTWLLDSENKVAGGQHRIEFHCDDRGHHFVVVPQTRRINADAGSGSRNGGESFDLAFVAIGNADQPTGILQEVAAKLKGAEQRLGESLGTIAAAIEVAGQIGSLPSTVLGRATVALARVRTVLITLTAALNRTTSIAATSTSFVISAMDLCDVVADALVAATRFADAETWHRMSRSLSDAAAAHKWLSTQDASGGTIAAGLATAGLMFDPATTLIDSGGPTSSADGAFADYAGKAAGYSGWIPYTPQFGMTLWDIALEVYGNANGWIAIAEANGLDSPLIMDSSTLKIPVSSGGIPWGPAHEATVDAMAAAIAEHIYHRDLKLVDIGGGRVDLAMADDSTTDIATITGLANYVQRYGLIVFRTELGENPTYPGVGIYRGIGDPTFSETRGLTAQTARGQLLADPRTVKVVTVVDIDTADRAEVEFRVTTANATTQFGV